MVCFVYLAWLCARDCCLYEYCKVMTVTVQTYLHSVSCVLCVTLVNNGRTSTVLLLFYYASFNKTQQLHMIHLYLSINRQLFAGQHSISQNFISWPRKVLHVWFITWVE